MHWNPDSDYVVQWTRYAKVCHEARQCFYLRLYLVA